ncbi:pyridoxal kinase, partial [Rhizobium ruizarguesonis]
AWLSGAALEDNSTIMEAALALGPSLMLVTSAVPMMAGGTGNLYLSGRHALLAEHRVVENPPNGLGDHDPEFTSRNVEQGAVEMKASRFFESLDVG